jgi:hypothetical protein
VTASRPRRPLRALVAAAGLTSLLALPAAAQAKKTAGRWTSIGRTSSGNEVFVDAKSVKRKGDLVDATVRAVFTTPVQTAKGPWKSSSTKATFDCRRKSLAAKENVFYADERGAKVTERKVNAIPGFGPALSGSLGAIALAHLCP